ncbi:Gamma-crystallin 1 [Dissostichus eleginoides]|uniref:Gamma-crystallin 1 n=1 Tax=Dissostichus eleginoides TaxID=100907 RepID=A0AAD9FIX5_DISEL|nr:Gamma-crystallin 1 [Dissostichus eleginoides]
MGKVKGICKLRVFDRPNFEGHSLELTENTKSIQEKWLRHQVQSCKVLEGSWILYEHPNFCGRQYMLEKGDYRHHSAWGALKSNVGSIRIIVGL